MIAALAAEAAAAARRGAGIAPDCRRAAGERAAARSSVLRLG